MGTQVKDGNATYIIKEIVRFKKPFYVDGQDDLGLLVKRFTEEILKC